MSLELLLLRHVSNHACPHVLLGTGHAHVTLRRGQLLDGCLGTRHRATWTVLVFITLQNINKLINTNCLIECITCEKGVPIRGDG